MNKMDFKKEALQYKDALLKDLKTLCQIPSTMDMSSAKDGQPFGEMPRVALDQMIAIGQRDGFVTDNCDGYAGSIDIGEGDDVFGILGHLDVVPVNKTGWHYPPFDCTQDGDMLYGRGVADDKGPLLAAYYAAKIINKMDFEKKMKIRVIFGTNEENGSECVAYYFKHRPYPALGFTPDADFPVVYGEKGIARINVKGHFAPNGLMSFMSGDVVNIVPGHAQAVVDSHDDLTESYQAYLEKHQLTGEIEDYHGKTKLTLKGVSAHGSTPELGQNAAVMLAHYLVDHVENDFVNFIDKYFYEDVNGKKLGVFKEGHMGLVTCNLGIISYSEGKGSLSIDFRLPHEMSEEEFIPTLATTFTMNHFTSFDYDWTNALFVNPESDLIKNLHQAYVDVTGDHEHGPQCMGGGTYAKEMPNCVAFGAEFPGHNNGMHQNDEHILIDDLMDAVAIYAAALYNILKK